MDKDNITPGVKAYFSWPIAACSVLIALIAGAWILLSGPEISNISLREAHQTRMKVAPQAPALTSSQVDASLADIEKGLAQVDASLSGVDSLNDF